MRRLLLSAATLGVLACSIPTELPIVEQKWALPFSSVELGQADFLPAGVDIDSISNTYDVQIDPFTAGESLANLCPICLLLPGTIADTVPAYTGDFSVTEDLPADVLAVDIESGAISITIDNDLSFDPIAGGGSVSIRVSGANGGATLATYEIDSATDSLPPGSSNTQTITLDPGTITGGIEAYAQVVSPGGQVAQIDNTAQIRLSAVVDTLLIRSATIVVDGRDATLSRESIDTSDLDTSVIDAVRGGRISMDVTNPFGVAFAGSFSIGPVAKNIVIGSDPVSTVDVAFTEQELRSFLGSAVFFSGGGTLLGGPALVSPDLSFEIKPTVEVDLEVGGTG